MGKHEKVVEFLLDRGSAMNSRDNQGDTALIKAVKSGKVNLVSVLTERGAAIDCKNNQSKEKLGYLNKVGFGGTIKSTQFYLDNL